MESKKKCSNCGSLLKYIKKKIILFTNGSMENVYSEYCRSCNNLVYGSVSPVIKLGG